MSIYFTHYSLIILFFAISFTSKEAKSYFYVAFFILITILAVFRFGVGVDYLSYVTIIDSYFLGSSVHFEIGYRYLISFLGFFIKNSTLVISFTSMLIATMFFYNILKYSKEPRLSLLLFYLVPLFYLASFNQLRQFLALSIVLFSIKFILNKEFFKFSLVILIAFLFHKSAIVFFPMYFLFQLKFSFKFFVFLIIGFISFVWSVEFLMKVLGISSIYVVDDLSESFSFFRVFFFMTLFIASLYFSSNVKEVDKNIVHLFNLMILMAALIMLLPLFITFLSQANITRLTSYFTVALIFIPTYYLNAVKGKLWKPFLYTSLIIASSIYYFLILIFNGERYSLIPYQTWW